MDAKTFLDRFETIADAPGGVDRLRKLILDLAVRGVLVAQDVGDEPAEGFVRRVEQERQRRLEAGLTRGGLDVVEGLAVEAPYSLPNGWQWTNFGAACINRDAERIPVRSTDRSLRHGVYDYYGASGVIDKIDDYLFEGELLLIGEDGANLTLRSTPIAFIASGRFWVNNHAHVIDSVSSAALRYLAVYVNSIDLKPYLTGIAQPKLNQKRLNSIPVPIPPEAEQGRIVKKVDELMRLCDDLEARQHVRQQVSSHLRAASFDSMTNAQTDHDVNTAWSRVHSNWDAFVNSEQGIEALRQAALLMAVKGWLVPQDSADEHATASIRRAAMELEGQAAVRGRGASKECIAGRGALSVGEPSAMRLPAGWAIAPLSSIARLESGHTPDRSISEYWDGPFPWIGIRDARRFRNGTVFETENTVTMEGINNSATRLLPAGTVCLSRTASVGYAVVMGRDMCTSQDFVNFLCTSAIAPSYLQLIFRAEGDALRRFSKGAVHQTIYFPEVKAFHVLLPPRQEQERILAKVAYLMQTCDELVAHMRARDTSQGMAAASICRHTAEH